MMPTATQIAIGPAHSSRFSGLRNPSGLAMTGAINEATATSAVYVTLSTIWGIGIVEGVSASRRCQ
jgi:hypothetical protein